MPMGDGVEIGIGGERVGPADLRFAAEEGEDGLDVTLHVRGLTKANGGVRGRGALLVAEHAVGEHDMLTLLGSMQGAPLPAGAAAEGLRPFRELVPLFDRTRQEK